MKKEAALDAASGKPQTRIQKRNRTAILDAALDVFSTHGFRGATVDQVARAAKMSKPNLLYYFPSKDAIHVALLSGLMVNWLDPLARLDPAGTPMQEVLNYVTRKVEMSRDFPRESRLFANEILQGAPRILPALQGDLKALVDEKCAVIQGWMDAGELAPMHPYHLMFSIWSLTQHYADFEVQIHAVLGQPETDFAEVSKEITNHFRKLLTP